MDTPPSRAPRAASVLEEVPTGHGDTDWTGRWASLGDHMYVVARTRRTPTADLAGEPSAAVRTRALRSRVDASSTIREPSSTNPEGLRNGGHANAE